MSNNKESPGLFQGVMLAYLILLLHVLLIAGLGVLIIFFKGIISYMPLIFFGGLLLVGGSAFILFRRLKSQGKSLRETLNSPMFSGKSLEISLLGGMASIKIDSNGSEKKPPLIESGERTPMLEDQKAARIRELTDLARQLENEQVDPDVFRKTGRKLFH